MLPLIQSEIAAHWNEIQAHAITASWRQHPNPMPDRIWLDNNGGKKIYIRIDLINKPPKDPYTLQDLEKIVWR